MRSTVACNSTGIEPVVVSRRRIGSLWSDGWVAKSVSSPRSSTGWLAIRAEPCRFERSNEEVGCLAAAGEQNVFAAAGLVCVAGLAGTGLADPAEPADQFIERFGRLLAQQIGADGIGLDRLQRDSLRYELLHRGGGPPRSPGGPIRVDRATCRGRRSDRQNCCLQVGNLLRQVGEELIVPQRIRLGGFDGLLQIRPRARSKSLRRGLRVRPIGVDQSAQNASVRRTDSN